MLTNKKSPKHFIPFNKSSAVLSTELKKLINDQITIEIVLNIFGAVTLALIKSITAILFKMKQIIKKKQINITVIP